MNKPTGGRGKKAPYESTHLRVPVPIKEVIQKLVDDYRQNMTIVNDEQLSMADELELLKNECQKLKEELQRQKSLTPLENAIGQAKTLLKQKKTKADAIAKLLTGIYHSEVASQDLLE